MHLHSDTRLQYDIVRVVSVLSYFTIIGWLIAALVYGNHKSALARFHLRDSLGLTLTWAVLTFIPLIGWILAVGLFFVWLIALYHAFNGQRNLLPVFGDFFQMHLDFIK